MAKTKQKDYVALIASRESRSANGGNSQKAEAGGNKQDAFTAYRQALYEWEQFVTQAALATDDYSTIVELDVPNPPVCPWNDSGVDALTEALARPFDVTDLVRHVIREPNKGNNWVNTLLLKSPKARTSGPLTRKRRLMLQKTLPYIQREAYMSPKYASIREIPSATVTCALLI